MSDDYEGITVKANYAEPCVCGCDKAVTEVMWRFVTWKCPKCGKLLASTLRTDTPYRAVCVYKRLITESNARLREEKGLPPKRTVVTLTDSKGSRITWSEINKENDKWAKRVGVSNAHV